MLIIKIEILLGLNITWLILLKAIRFKTFLSAVIPIVLLFTGNLYAETYIGLGFSGVTHGRNIPALHVAWVGKESRISFISTGVKTPVYYHNAYQLGWLSTWKAGDLFLGELEAGFGGAILHGVRGYRDDTDSSYDKETNTVFGPAIYIGWEILPHVMISMETIFGIYKEKASYLIFQENCAGSIGVKF